MSYKCHEQCVLGVCGVWSVDAWVVHIRSHRLEHKVYNYCVINKRSFCYLANYITHLMLSSVWFVNLRSGYTTRKRKKRKQKSEFISHPHCHSPVHFISCCVSLNLPYFFAPLVKTIDLALIIDPILIFKNGEKRS